MRYRTRTILSLILCLALVIGMSPILSQPVQAGDFDQWTVLDKSTVKASEIPAGAWISLKKDVTLVLDKNLSVECIDGWDYEANKCYSLTVKDSGGHKVSVHASEADYGINVKAFTLDSGTVEIITDAEDSGGLFAETEGIILKGGTLKVDSKKYGIYARNGKIQITNAELDISTSEKGSEGIISQAGGDISITGSNVDVEADAYGIHSRAGRPITITDSTIHIKTNSNGIGTSGGLKIKDSTAYIEAVVYSLVSVGAPLSIEGSAVKATARTETEPEFSGYSSNPVVKWSTNRDGSGAVKWNGTPKLNSSQVQYFEVNWTGEGDPTPGPQDETTYHITVGGGTANKTEAKAGETVTISGISGKSDFRFDGWEVLTGNAAVKDPTQDTTTFLMPAGDVKIGAKYRHFVLDPTAGIAGKPNPFVDVAKGSYYYEPVLWAYHRSPQVTNGIDKDHFGPAQTVTRGQCVTFLWRAKGYPEPKTTTNPFVDVKSGEYWYEPILWAVGEGITLGTDANHFSPTQTLSTAHIATFLYRAMGIGADGYYEEAGNWAQKEGLLDGTGLSVAPGVDCPRGGVVTFLYRELTKPKDEGPVNELKKDDFLLHVEDTYAITGRGKVVTGRVLNGSIKVGDQVSLLSYEEAHRSPTTNHYTVLGIEMFKKSLDKAEKGDNVGIFLSADTSLNVLRGAALVQKGSKLKNTPGVYVGTVALNNTRKNPLTKGDTFQLSWTGSDVTAMMIDLNGGDLKPNTTRNGVSVVLAHPTVWYVGQELPIRAGGQTWGTFTITEVE